MTAEARTVDYVVTFLEMTERPRWPQPPMPAGHRLAILRAEAPPVGYFVHLYRSVGAAHHWTDWLERPEDELAAFVGAETTALFTMVLDGWPGGFFMLDMAEAPVCELAYFGLVPEAIGRGLGHWLLATAIHTAWDQMGTERLTVHTNTLDHPRALGLYQKMGFEPVRREAHSRLVHDGGFGAQ